MLDQATGVKSLEAANPYRTIQPLGYLRVPEARGTENLYYRKGMEGRGLWSSCDHTRVCVTVVVCAGCGRHSAKLPPWPHGARFGT